MDDHLSAEDLLACAATLLRPGGTLNVILPTGPGNEFMPAGERYGLYPARKTVVLPICDKPPHRLMIELIKSGERPHRKATEDELIIQESRVRNHFTADYRRLVGDLYTIL
jgi:tRNA1(Val) A37 N6-methylase TrmN6